MMLEAAHCICGWCGPLRDAADDSTASFKAIFPISRVDKAYQRIVWQKQDVKIPCLYLTLHKM